jgi:serine/threonine-protein phosphatase 4 regulatory subunit 1
MTAAVLLNRLASRLGPDLCTQFVIPEVLSLAEDTNFRVRKATALNFENVCAVGGEYEWFERLIPAFVRLSKDEMYRVRRACADSLTTISKTLSKDLREGVMVEIFLRLSQDPSKLVRQSVLLQAGRFITSLSSRAVSEHLLGIFISLADSPTGDASIDNELKHECAYSFPGVFLTIGHERWDSLREVTAAHYEYE